MNRMTRAHVEAKVDIVNGTDQPDNDSAAIDLYFEHVSDEWYDIDVKDLMP